MHTVNYFRVIDWGHNAANWTESYRKDHRNGKTKLKKAYLYTNLLKKPAKMTNSTSTDVTFGGSWCNRVVGKQENSSSTAPVEKQINE